MEFIDVITGNYNGRTSNTSILEDSGGTTEDESLERGRERNYNGEYQEDDSGVISDGSSGGNEVWPTSKTPTVGDAIQFITQNLQVQMRDTLEEIDLKIERTDQVARIVALEQSIRNRIMQKLQMGLKMVEQRLNSNKTGESRHLLNSILQEHSRESSHLLNSALQDHSEDSGHLLNSALQDHSGDSGHLLNSALQDHSGDSEHLLNSDLQEHFSGDTSSNIASISSVIISVSPSVSPAVSPASSLPSSTTTSSTKIHTYLLGKRKFADAFCLRENEDGELVEVKPDHYSQAPAVHFPHPPSPRCSANHCAVRHLRLEDEEACPPNFPAERMSRPRLRSLKGVMWLSRRRSNGARQLICEEKTNVQHSLTKHSVGSHESNRCQRSRARWVSDPTVERRVAPRRLPSASPPPAPRRRSARRVRMRDIIGRNLVRAVDNAQMHDVVKLLDAGADVNFATAGGWVLLHRAARKAHVDTLSLLLERGANVHARTTYGFTALHIAAYNDPTGWCASFLVAAGSDVNCKNNSGRTPLHSAAEASNVKTILVLLEAGAQKTATNDDGKQPHQLARSESIRCMLD